MPSEVHQRHHLGSACNVVATSRIPGMQDGVKDMDEDAGRKAQKIGLDSKLGEPQRPNFCSTSGNHERGMGAPARRSLGREKRYLHSLELEIVQDVATGIQAKRVLADGRRPA